jgi:hypothetical protein
MNVKSKLVRNPIAYKNYSPSNFDCRYTLRLQKFSGIYFPDSYSSYVHDNAGSVSSFHQSVLVFLACSHVIPPGNGACPVLRRFPMLPASIAAIPYCSGTPACWHK